MPVPRGAVSDMISIKHKISQKRSAWSANDVGLIYYRIPIWPHYLIAPLTSDFKIADYATCCISHLGQVKISIRIKGRKLQHLIRV
jgi:hypothetical protein